MPKISNAFAPLISIVASILVAAFLILALGKNPIVAFSAMFSGALGDIFGSRVNFGETILRMSPLLFVGLGVGFAMHCKIWNIGAEGQLFIGALFSTLVAFQFESWSPWILIPMTVVAAFIGGGAYAAIPGFFRAYYKVDEIVTTFLMNFVAFYFIGYLTRVPMRDPEGWLPYSKEVGENAVLPILASGTRINIGILIGLFCAVVLYVVINQSTKGYELKAVGMNPSAARFAGISVEKTIIFSLIVSGGMAGLAGMGEVQGNLLRLQDTISPGYGFTGIVVALMGRRHPMGIVLAALFFAVLRVGGEAMQEAANISTALVGLLQGFIVLFVIGSELIVNEALRGELLGRFWRQASE